MTFSVDKDEIRAFVAIPPANGYWVFPQRPMMWEQSEDVHNGAVSQLMTSDRFDEILRYLHLADTNNLAAGDKLAKASLFYEMMNGRFVKSF